MALVIPNEARTQTKTEGEGRLLHALDIALDDECVIWYEPMLGRKRLPDIVVYIPNYGIVIYEVKDWPIHVIDTNDGHNWLILQRGSLEPYRNPLRQAQDYFGLLSDRLKVEPSFRQTKGSHAGKLKLPIATAVVFPNITREQYYANGLQTVIERDFVLLSEDLSNIEADPTNAHEYYGAHFNTLWRGESLNPIERERLIAIITPRMQPSLKVARKGHSSSLSLLESSGINREHASQELLLAKEDTQRLKAELERIQEQRIEEASIARANTAKIEVLEERYKEAELESARWAQTTKEHRLANEEVQRLREDLDSIQAQLMQETERIARYTAEFEAVTIRYQEAEAARERLEKWVWAAAKARQQSKQESTSAPIKGEQNSPSGYAFIGAISGVLALFLALAALLIVTRGGRTTSEPTPQRSVIAAATVGTPTTSTRGIATPGNATSQARVTVTKSGPGSATGTIVARQATAVSMIAWSPDGQRLGSVSRDGSAWLWRATDTSSRQLPAENARFVTIAWAPGGALIAAGAEDGSVHLWDSQGQPFTVLRDHTSAVHLVAWSRRGDLLATGDRGGVVRLWNATSRQRMRLTDDLGTVGSLAWSPDDRLASTSADGAIQLWAKDGRRLATLPGNSLLVRQLAWSPNGALLASSSGNTVRLWRSDGGMLSQIEAHRDLITGLVWSPDSARLASSSRDASIVVWSANGQPIATLPTGAGPVLALAWSPDGATLASAGDDYAIRLWDRAGQPIAVLRGHTEAITNLQWRPESDDLTSASVDTTIRLWR